MNVAVEDAKNILAPRGKHVGQKLLDSKEKRNLFYKILHWIQILQKWDWENF